MKFVAIDWGTSSFRAWLIEHDQIVAELESDRGVKHFSQGDHVAYLQEALLDWQGEYKFVIAIGMIGSSIGLYETKFSSLPIDLDGVFKSLIKRAHKYVIPVYDFQLVTEPLTSEQLQSIGWSEREGLTDAGNQFHYYRLTKDNEILWGGYDAIYNFRGKVRLEYETDAQTYAHLAEAFLETFPQLKEWWDSIPETVIKPLTKVVDGDDAKSNRYVDEVMNTAKKEGWVLNPQGANPGSQEYIEMDIQDDVLDYIKNN